MTSASKKSNLDYLRELLYASIKTELRNEALEFLDAIQDQLANKQVEIDEVNSELSTANKQIDELRMENDSLEEKVTELEDAGSGLRTIDCGIGKIWWKTDNMLLQSKMETVANNLGIGYTVPQMF